MQQNGSGNVHIVLTMDEAKQLDKPAMEIGINLQKRTQGKNRFINAFNILEKK
jgi:hypothetical protein